MSLERAAVLGKGFRLFFLLAALYAAVILPAWLLVVGGHVGPNAHFGGPLWHAHEMVFGFTLAVIAGFLLTAVSNWTSRETLVGAPLAALAGLWVAGRVAVLLSERLPGLVTAVVDLAFVPALAVACARPLVAARSRRNYGFLLIFAVLFAANLAMHLGALGLAPALTLTRRGASLAVHGVVLVILVVTGRVVPLFTRNATKVTAIRSLPRVDALALGGMAGVTVLDLLDVSGRATALVSACTGGLVLARAAFWGAQHTARVPLLWVLHVGHAFVAVGLLLRGLGALSPAVPPTAGLHALTAGAMGVLTLGMMARVALGHSGRPLEPRPVVALAFVLVVLAAVVRVVGPLVAPGAHVLVMTGSGGAFALAFAIYAAVYAPILVSPRVDGRPG